VEFGSAFPADGEAFELVEQGEGLLHDVADLAQALDVRGALAGDDRQDSALAQLLAVAVGVVALVAEQRIGAAAWPAGTPGYGRDAVDQGEGLGDVVDVGRGGDDFERGAASVADQTSDAFKESSCGREDRFRLRGKCDVLVVADAVVEAVVEATDHAVEEIAQGGDVAVAVGASAVVVGSGAG
jgi:hypothetical protein